MHDYLEGVYHTIVVKDIAARKKISDTMMLESVTRFVFDSIGSQLSTKKIADTMTSSGRKIDVKTVERYLEGLMESFIIYQAKRYNIRGKQYLKTLEKYYVVDIGMRYMLLGTSGTDVGHILENIVYLELLRRGYEVYIGKAQYGFEKKEIMNLLGITAGNLDYIASYETDRLNGRAVHPVQSLSPADKSAAKNKAATMQITSPGSVSDSKSQSRTDTKKAGRQSGKKKKKTEEQENTLKKRGPGRPKGSRNKPKAAEPASTEKRKPGRPKGSTNKPKV